MKKKFFRIGCLLSAVLTVTCLTAGCTKSAKLPDLSSLGEIDVVVREEGSGTRVEFETLADTNEKGADILVESTEEVIKTVASSKDTIGYVAYSAVMNEKSFDEKTVSDEKNGSSLSYKAISVDGIEVLEKNIKKGKYPLCRDYIIAYKGEQSALEQDFMKYIMSQGQNIVSEFCIPKCKTSSFLSDNSSGKMLIEGSSSVAPIMQKLIDGYKKYNKNAQIVLTVSDSSSGLNTAIQGQCDWAISSRSLKDYEKELLETRVIGSDAIAILVNKDNPVENLTMKQIRGIYDKDFEKWEDIK